MAISGGREGSKRLSLSVRKTQENERRPWIDAGVSVKLREGKSVSISEPELNKRKRLPE